MLTNNGTAVSSFSTPIGVASDGVGNVYVADYINSTVRKIKPGGVVTTLAGAARQDGSADGTGPAARFNNPHGVATDRAGNIYVGDFMNFTIRKITPAGAVTTMAGTAGQSGSADGTGTAARFADPTGIATDGSGNVYVADLSNYTIRKITPAGVVTTMAGTAGQFGSADGAGPGARFYKPLGVATDSAGNIYVADTGNNTVRKITPGGVVTTLAGTAGQTGSADGIGAAARFNGPSDIAIDAAGNAYIVDNSNNTIRKLTPAGVVTTLAGTAGQTGSADGTGAAARFNHPLGIAIDSAGNLYIGDSFNNTIRKVAPGAGVTTLAGQAGVAASADSNAPVTISSVTVTGDFASTGALPNSLQVGQSSDVAITFTPTSAGLRTGTLSITDNAAGSPHTVSLTGTGAAPAVTLSPSSLEFGLQAVGTTSAPRLVTLTNTGTAPLNVSSITISGDFAQTNTCTKTATGRISIASGANCFIFVTFSPTASGVRLGTLTINDNAAGSPHTVSLIGWGAFPSVSLSPLSLNFASQAVGSDSSPQTVTLTNTGTVAVTITTASITGNNPSDFTLANSCGNNLQPNASCRMSITFKPVAGGTRTALLTVTDNATGAPHTVALNGLGVVPGIALYPSGLMFGTQPVDTTSAPQLVTLTNTGNSPLTITNVAASSDFAQTNNYAGVVMPGANCTISVTFTPTGSGLRTGIVTIADSSPGSPQTVTLTGTGTQPFISISPASLTFAVPSIGTSSVPQTVTLQNTGTAPLNIEGVSVTGANSSDFFYSVAGSATLAPGQSTSISVTFTPSAGGMRSAQLNITDNASGSPQLVSLTGNITGPAVALSPPALVFGPQAIGSPSTAQAVTLTNTGQGPLTITSVTTSGDFTQVSPIVSPLAGGASCTFSVTFKPTGGGTRTGTLIIWDSAVGSPHTVSLTGSGLYSESFEFFYQDDQRTYYVSLPQATSSGLALAQPAANSAAVALPRIQFYNHFHPHICAFIEALNRDGIPGLLTLANQQLSNDKPNYPTVFETKYSPIHSVAVPPYPLEDVDFNHGPMRSTIGSCFSMHRC
jgi:sugar lactone lactonase YvrE